MSDPRERPGDLRRRTREVGCSCGARPPGARRRLAACWDARGVNGGCARGRCPCTRSPTRSVMASSAASLITLVSTPRAAVGAGSATSATDRNPCEATTSSKPWARSTAAAAAWLPARPFHRTARRSGRSPRRSDVPAPQPDEPASHDDVAGPDTPSRSPTTTTGILRPRVVERRESGTEGARRYSARTCAVRPRRRATLLWVVKVCLLPAFGQASDGPLGRGQALMRPRCRRSCCGDGTACRSEDTGEVSGSSWASLVAAFWFSVGVPGRFLGRRNTCGRLTELCSPGRSRSVAPVRDAGRPGRACSRRDRKSGERLGAPPGGRAPAL